jgi:dTMP kinase
VPALESGVSVISDRCFLETLAYQGYARGLDKDFICHLNNVVMQGIVPDVSFIIDGGYEEMSRNSNRKFKDYDRLDREKADFHKKVREGLLDISKQYDFCQIIPYIGNGEDEMQDMMRNTLVEKLSL